MRAVDRGVASPFPQLARRLCGVIPELFGGLGLECCAALLVGLIPLIDVTKGGAEGGDESLIVG